MVLIKQALSVRSSEAEVWVVGRSSWGQFRSHHTKIGSSVKISALEDKFSNFASKGDQMGQTFFGDFSKNDLFAHLYRNVPKPISRTKDPKIKFTSILEISSVGLDLGFLWLLTLWPFLAMWVKNGQSI